MLPPLKGPNPKAPLFRSCNHMSGVVRSSIRRCVEHFVWHMARILVVKRFWVVAPGYTQNPLHKCFSFVRVSECVFVCGCLLSSMCIGIFKRFGRQDELLASAAECNEAFQLRLLLSTSKYRMTAHTCTHIKHTHTHADTYHIP